MLTATDLANRTDRARDAATAAARSLGVDVHDARVVYDVFSVVVDLAPAPVIARVPTVLPGSSTPESQRRLQVAELDVTRWLAARGEPTVVPSPLVPAEPVRADGFAMTFWQKVDGVVEPALEMPERVRRTAHLHAVLRDYPGPVRYFTPFADGFMADALAFLAERPDLLPADDLDRARREWAVLEPLATSEDALLERFPHAAPQVVHGDAPYYNLIETADAVYYSDFEHVMRGPVEADLAHVGAEAVATYDAAAADLGLRPVDPALLAVVERLRDLQVVGCLAMVDQLPMLAEGVKPSIDAWRASEFAGGAV
ncbi:aminoglycoside phosphotransferase/kinase family protein [Actinokineospora bangkokensis]|uniref:Aminoglycoside phosphotransferase n=1 Tax=Actinokineospora bangkokensis TaxID=1193682 RepID=A0A1Q9LNW0_9PSEU|nr:phosphotransferase [Actinokineospora bangkokensis]OLR93736.1 aminoglycoside phosphotransferase [Actinokineospora bangkokensis]